MIAHATTATWVVGGGADNNWDTSGNWNPSEPNATDDEAIFNTAGATPTVDVPVALGVLEIDANATINGSNTVTMETNDLTPLGPLPAINVTGSGTVATINAPLSYSPNLNVIGTPRMNFNVASGATLNLDGGLSSSGTAGNIDFASGTIVQGSGSGAAFNIGTPSGIYVGDDGTAATLYINSNISDASTFIVGEQEAVSTIAAGTGTVYQSAGAVSTTGTIRIGQAIQPGAATYVPGVTAGLGTYDLSGGSLTTASGVNVVVGSQQGTGTMNISGASTTLSIGGEMTLASNTGTAAGNGGSGQVTATDSTITDGLTNASSVALAIGAPNATASSTLTLTGSSASSGARYVIPTSEVQVADASVGNGTTNIDAATGSNGTILIQDASSMVVGSVLFIGVGIPSHAFQSPNTGLVSITGTTPAAFTSKFSVGSTMNIGTSGGIGTFSANLADTTPILIGSATTSSVITLATSGTYTNLAGESINGGTGTINLAGNTVMDVNSSLASGNIIADGSSAANALVSGTNIGSTGNINLSNNAVLNVNQTSPNALNIVVGNGVANKNGDAGSGTITMNNTSELNLLKGNLIVGFNETPGVVNVNDQAQISVSNAAGEILVGGHSASADGSPDFSATSFSALNVNGTSMVTAPTVQVGIGVNGQVTVSGGTLDATTGGIALGSSAGAGGTAATVGNGILTVTGGTVELGGGGNMVLSSVNTSTTSEKGTLNIQGGLVQISGALQSSGLAANSLVNFTGGELQVATITATNLSSSVSQAALPVALQQTSSALVQSNSSGSSLLHAATGSITDSGGYVLLGGTAQADGANGISIGGLTSINNGTIQGSGTFATSATSGFGINGTLTVAGPGIVNLNGPSLNQPGATLAVTGGTVNVSAASATPGTVTIGTGGTVNLNGAVPANASVTVNGTMNLATNLDTSVGVATLGSLTIGASGQFNIANNHVFINYGNGTDPVASIAAWLKSGYAGGSWNGPGINSTAAQSNNSTPGNLLYGVGYADSADQGNPAGLSSGTIEVAYALLGDANLSGVVDGTDFGIVAANFNKGVTGWDQGDFNYDNVVDGTDFGDLAANFNKGAAGAQAVAALDAFAAAHGLLADVPEPASMGMLALGITSVLARRRRRQH